MRHAALVLLVVAGSILAGCCPLTLSRGIPEGMHLVEPSPQTTHSARPPMPEPPPEPLFQPPVPSAP